MFALIYKICGIVKVIKNNENWAQLIDVVKHQNFMFDSFLCVALNGWHIILPRGGMNLLTRTLTPSIGLFPRGKQ